MFALFAGRLAGGQWSFAIALILMIVSLGISLRELQVSVGALDLLLTDLEEHEKMGYGYLSRLLRCRRLIIIMSGLM